MFKSEASLFLSANNKVNSAKTLINECKRLIIDFNLEGNTDCNNLKNNINGCDIDALVTLVENTKTSLMEFEEGFAGDYMALLEEYLNNPTLDTTQMSDEEMMQYSIYMRDYNQILLYTLEKYEAAGMLTEEMEGYLAYQRELVAQYELQDQMAVLDPASDEYIELFKQNADYSRNLISLNPNLTPEQKESYLAEFEIEYEENLAALTTARDEKVQRQQDEQELQELYDSKEDNNGFFHPFVESSIDEAILDKRIEMGIATEDEIEYKNMGGFDRFLVDSGTFLTSTYAGLFNIVEGMSDGVVMLTSAVGTDEYKSWATEYISRDISGEMYQGIVLSTDMNSYSAYGTWHDAGLVFGETLGKAGMTFAAPWANALMSGFNAMGQSAETSFINGEDYWLAFGKSVVHGVAGAAEGYAGSKMNLQFRELVNSGALKVVGKSALDGLRNVGTTLASPGGLKVVGGNLLNIVKSQAPTVLKTAGMATLKDADTWIETGCTFASNILEGVGNGDIDLKQTLLETGTVFAMNYGMNFISGVAFDINGNKVDGVTDAKRVTVEAKEIEIRTILQGKYPEVDLSSYNFDELKGMYPTEIKDITIKQYGDIVYGDKSGYYDAHGMPKTAAKYDYDALHGTGAFEKLSLDEQAKLIDVAKTKMPVKGTAQYDILVRQYADDVASKTVSTLEGYKAAGKIKEGYEVDDILRMIQDDVDPSVYLTQEAIDEWRKQWRVDSTAPVGKVNTYTFQPEGKSALGFGSVGYGAKDGFIGEGAFALTESKYNWIMDPQNGIFDANGVCINKTKLSEVLGGVQFGSGGIVVVKQTIPEQSLRMATGNLQGAFIGDWCPGGSTSGGAIEGLTPPAGVTKSNSRISGNSLFSKDTVNVNGVNYDVKTEITMFGSSGSSQTSYNGQDIYDKLKK